MNMKKRTLFISIGTILVTVLLMVFILKGVVFSPKETKPAETPTAVAEVTEPAPTEPQTEPPTEAPTEPETEPEPEPVTISLLAVGDLLMHASVSTPALQSDGSYNYDYLFTDTRAAIEAADIACINNEVIFGGDSLGIQTYPLFNGITPMGFAEIAAGFDVFSCATNHTYDQGLNGVLNCVTFWNTCFPGAMVLGIYNDPAKVDEIPIIERQGIRVAMLNYTYGLNGNRVPEGYEWTVNMLTEENKPKIANDIARAKELADFVVVFPHWGEEYELRPRPVQTEWAEFFAEAGVDLVIGTHPHVPEPVAYVTSSTGHQMLCFYSLGNYISGQYFYDTMLEGMAHVAITKDGSGTYISDYSMEFLVNHFEPGNNVIHTYYLRDYTDALLARHSQVHTGDPYYINANAGEEYSIAALRKRANYIYPGGGDF